MRSDWEIRQVRYQNRSTETVGGASVPHVMAVGMMTVAMVTVGPSSPFYLTRHLALKLPMFFWFLVHYPLWASPMLLLELSAFDWPVELPKTHCPWEDFPCHLYMHLFDAAGNSVSLFSSSTTSWHKKKKQNR
ncbi:hypothetical protein ACFX2J_011109 [Malus domestica]